MAFSQLDWIAFVGFFIAVFVPWFYIPGLGWWSVWYLDLQKAMQTRWKISNVPGWIYSIFWFIVAIAVWIAIFLFWRNLKAADLYDEGIILFLITLLLVKLWEPIMFSGPSKQSPSTVWARLIWSMVHTFFIFAAALATTILFGLAADQTKESSGWVAMGLMIFWLILIIIQCVWSVMAYIVWMNTGMKTTLKPGELPPQLPPQLPMQYQMYSNAPIWAPMQYLNRGTASAFGVINQPYGARRP